MEEIGSLAHLSLVPRQWTGAALVQIMACHLVCRCQAIILTNADILLIRPLEQNSVTYWSKFIYFHLIKYIWTGRLWNGGHFVQGDIS